MVYEPYFGPCGPTDQQRDDNTRALGEELQKAGIPFVEDNRQWARLNWGGDELNLLIKKGNIEIVAGYDRWGFVVESDFFIPLDVEQECLTETVEAIKNWYFQ